MTQSRRPAGTPVGGQFAPTNRPRAGDLGLVDADCSFDRYPTTGPALEGLDEGGRRLAEHLGYDYAPIDAVDKHHGLTTEPGTIGLISHDGGEHFIVVGTSTEGHVVLPFGTDVFTPDELESEIAGRVDAPGRRAGQRTVSPPQRYQQANTVREGSRSPWGVVDEASSRAVGITDVGTPGHGGVKLSAERNRAVHPAWRRPGGWYEEDCEWAIVAMTFPECYSPEHAAFAKQTARSYFPDAYEVVTGERIKPGESYVRDQDTFFAEHADDWVTTSALAVDPGTVERIVRDDGVTGGLRLMPAEQPMVKVWARVGGRRSTAPETRAFLVPKTEYETRGRFGFVLDPDKYEEVAP